VTVANIPLDQRAQQLLAAIIGYRIGCFGGHSCRNANNGLAVGQGFATISL